MKKQLSSCSLVALLAVLATASSARTEAIDPMAGTGRLDRLPEFRSSVKVGAITSYDRTEGNDDGFSGKYSFVRKEGSDLVLADLKGPGVIYRIHTPTPTSDPIEFYFDGETTPRIRTNLNALYHDNKPPYAWPLVVAGGGGCVSYVPIPYEKSCKVLLRAKSFQFYDLNYATFPAGTKIKSYDGSLAAQIEGQLGTLKSILDGDKTKDLSAFNMPKGAKTKVYASKVELREGQTTVLFESKKGGRIASIRLSPASAFAGNDRDVLLKITWDGDKQPAVLCPVGDFFGYGWGKPSVESALLGTHENVNYCNLPMPYRKSAKIELISLRKGEPITVESEVIVGNVGQKRNEGKFYAYWNRENPTTSGKPYTFIKTEGKGHLVGLILQAQGMVAGNTYFFEGDDKTIIDGEMVIHGTGSEDFFNGGWYDLPGQWDRTVSFPLSGCLAYQKQIGRTGGYRFMLGDAYAFSKSIDQTIEHAPERNELITDYSSVAFLYMEKPPTVTMNLPDLKTRQVVDLAGK